MLKVITHTAPRLVWRYRSRAWLSGRGEPELALIPKLCDRQTVALDVGAAAGEFAIHMAGHAHEVWAFEPQAEQATTLRTIYGGTHVRVEEVALSDHEGHALLRIPGDRGRSTIEARNPLLEVGNIREVRVAVRALDSYRFVARVSVMKIDVEGHEEAVLRGAANLLSADRPALIIEIEERHNPGGLDRVRILLPGYGLYTLCGGDLGAVRDACPACGAPGCRHNNKVFLPAGHHLAQ